MGCQQSRGRDAEQRRSDEVELELSDHSKAENDRVKLLLLGAGESGKSTLFRQFKILYGQVSEGEKRHMTSEIFGNVNQAIQKLAHKAVEFGLRGEVQAPKAFDIVIASDYDRKMDAAMGDAIKELWADPAIQKVWARRTEFHIIESNRVFLDDIERISRPGYLASERDVLFARVRTAGVVTERFDIDGSIFEIYDVGGQRNERRKWIHCFDSVTAVIFVVALSEFDQYLFEDRETNRMEEALELFRTICNNRLFINASMIIFLNKKDLFQAKVERVNIAEVSPFEDYAGEPHSYEDGIRYFESKFLSLSLDKQKPIYVHTTCATDSQNVDKIFSSCTDTIIRQTLAKAGFV